MSNQDDEASDGKDEFREDVAHNGEEGARGSNEATKRTRKQTEKGQNYQDQLLKNMFLTSRKQIENQLRVLERLLDTGTSSETLNSEGSRLDRLFSDLLEIVARCQSDRDIFGDQDTIDQVVHIQEKDI